MKNPMNRTSLTSIAPEIFRKRLIVEGYYRGDMGEESIRRYFKSLTEVLALRAYGEPVIHRTSGQGKAANEGYDGFVPLIDSGIYIAAWTGPMFLSTIIYTCAEFDADRAVMFVRDFFSLSEFEAAIF
jgi:S-adenosylmethionine decarboxylase